MNKLARTLLTIFITQSFFNSSPAFSGSVCEFVFLKAKSSSQVETQLLSAKWVHRLRVRYSFNPSIHFDHSVGALVEAVNPNLRLAKEARQKFLVRKAEARRLMDVFNNPQNPSADQNSLYVDWQRSSRQIVFPVSEYLKNIGVSHLLVFQEDGLQKAVVLPRGVSAWSELARQLYEKTGTLLLVDSVGRSYFDRDLNALMISFETALKGPPTALEMQIAKNLVDGKVFESEFPVTGSDTVSVPDMLKAMDPEKAVPGSLQYISLFPGYDSIAKGIIPTYRYSVRTGKVSELETDIRRSLEAMIAYQKSSGQMVATVGLRNNQSKKWQNSFPEVGTSEQMHRFLAEGVGALEVEKLPVRSIGNSTHLPDVFLMISGTRQMTGPSVQLIRSLVDTSQGLNSVSFVVVVANKTHGPLYYIHTVDMRFGFDLTTRVDQLKKHFDHLAEIQATGKTWDPYNPK